MSKIKLEGNASGTGTLTISAPNTNTDRSITLPDGAGEILTDASTLSSSNLSGAIGTSNMPSGTIVQTVIDTLTSNVSTTSTSFVDTGLSVSITPTSTSNEIICIVSLASIATGTSSTSAMGIQIQRDGTNISQTTNFGYGQSNNSNYFTACLQAYDAPATTSALTYKVTFKNRETASAVVINSYAGNNSQLTVMEIAR